MLVQREPRRSSARVRFDISDVQGDRQVAVGLSHSEPGTAGCGFIAGPGGGAPQTKALMCDLLLESEEGGGSVRGQDGVVRVRLHPSGVAFDGRVVIPVFEKPVTLTTNSATIHSRSTHEENGSFR